MRFGRGRSGAVVVVVAALLAACSEPGRWENPNVAESQWSVDLDACRARGQAEAEREFQLQQQAGATANRDLGGQWQSDMNRFSAQRRSEEITASCMIGRGYRLVPASEETAEPAR